MTIEDIINLLICLSLAFSLYLIGHALIGMAYDTWCKEQAHRQAQQDAVQEAELYLAVQSEAQEGE
jgi:hypothetical protein